MTQTDIQDGIKMFFLIFKMMFTVLFTVAPTLYILGSIGDKIYLKWKKAKDLKVNGRGGELS